MNHLKTTLTISAFAVTAAFLTFTTVAPESASAHCQVPCGIYDDAGKFTELEQHIATVEKAMTQIIELSAKSGENQNQIVRWTINKESHAQKIQDEVSSYFLAQRVKLPAAGDDKNAYFSHLVLLHEVTVYAMKCKQTTDVANVTALKKSLAAYKAAYFKK
ncbi:MAG: nickel superoxide dismutase [Verrucomicrobiales bacterium]|jgi:nickel superoxide dismutase